MGAGLFDDFFSVLVLLEEGGLSEGWVTRSVTGLIHTPVKSRSFDYLSDGSSSPKYFYLPSH